MKDQEYIFISNGYRGGNITFLADHILYLTRLKKKITLIDDNPHKTYQKIPNTIKIKKIKTNKFSQDSEKKLFSVFFNKKNKKILFISNFAFLIKYYSLIKKFKKKKYIIILTIHSGLLNLNIKNYIAGFIFSFIYHQVDYLFFGSFSAKDWWLKKYPWMKINNCLVYYNGVKITSNQKIKNIKSKINISFVGRLEKENNPELFMNIAKEYLKFKKDAIFHIFGDGSLSNYLQYNNEENRIIFHGWTKKDKIYKLSDIILITSPINNFPYVALEAKSYGIPVISCSKGDIKKIIKNNFDGYIIYTNSSKKIINLIKKILKNYSKFSLNSIQRSKLFEINVACKKFWNNIL